jgi:hypothetical protein
MITATRRAPWTHTLAGQVADGEPVDMAAGELDEDLWPQNDGRTLEQRNFLSEARI